VIGPLAQRRQRRRLRITPNTNTSTTTMISTHNHPDMAASLVGAGAVQADATAAHPGGQLAQGQATSRAGIDGHATRGLAGPCTPRPAHRAGLAGQMPDRPRPCQATLRVHECSLAPSASGLTTPGSADHASAPMGRALRATPTHPNRIDQHHTSGGPGRCHPTEATTVSPTRRLWRGREAFALLGWGTIRPGSGEHGQRSVLEATAAPGRNQGGSLRSMRQNQI
jgi:hypothetical protein